MERIVYEDFTDEVAEEIKDVVNIWLEEASAELTSQTAQRTRRGSGETAGKWDNVVDRDKHVAMVGNPLENAIWEEFGTGEYALNDDGRKGGWSYFDERLGKWVHTYGKTPNRALHGAFINLEQPIKERLENMLRGMS